MNEQLSPRDRAVMREQERLRQVWEHYAGLPLDEVIRLLAHGSGAERSLAAQQLVQRQDPRAVEPLIRALADPNENTVAEYASDALVALGPQVIPHLIRTLSDGSAPRRKAIRALGNTHDARAFDPLAAIMRDREGEDELIRATATYYLGRVHDPRVVPALVERARDQTEPIQVRQSALFMLRERRDTRAVEPLIALVLNESEDRSIRARAVAVLGTIGDSRAFAALARLLPTMSDAARALAGLGPIGAPPLLDALAHGDADTRQAAARALGRLRDPRALKLLLAALGDSDAQVRAAVAYGLGQFDDDRVLDVLGELLARKDEVAVVRASAASGLSSSGERALEPLVRALSDEDGVVRLMALQSIRAITSKLRVTQNAQPADRVVEAVLALLHDREARVRQMAIDTLGWFKDARAVDPLLAAATDDDIDVRLAVIDALGNIADLGALPTLERLEQNDTTVTEVGHQRSIKAAARQAIRDIRREHGLDL